MNRMIMRTLLVSAVCLAVPASGLCHEVTNIVFTPPSPEHLELGEHVDVTFDYETTEPGGVRIFVRPQTGGYSAHGSSVYPVGSGSGTGYFTYNSGTADVSRVRIWMTNEDQSAMLFEVFFDVDYQFGPNVPSETGTWGEIKTLYR